MGESENKERELRTITACPECDSPRVRFRSKAPDSQLGPGDPAYKCDSCRHEFDEPVTRKEHSPNSAGTTHPGGRALLNADPEEWP